MKLEVKNLKYFASGSEETNCFTAVLYQDGIRTLSVTNQGQGGSNNYQLLTVKNTTYDQMRQKVDQINEYLKANYPPFPPCFEGDKEMAYDIEAFIDQEIERLIMERSAKRFIKKGDTCFQTPTDKIKGNYKIYNGKWNPLYKDQIINRIRILCKLTETDAIIILNETLA